MRKEYRQQTWDEALIDDCRQLIRLAVREDLDRGQDWTTLALVSPTRQGVATVRARQAGVICGLQAAAVALDEMEATLEFRLLVQDGATVAPGQGVATLEGSVRDMLTCERIVLNLIGRLSGVSTLTARYVAEVAGTDAGIYDTRKTTPGWRRLEKFAVQCGGGTNHRNGLYDGILIKDNHLASKEDGADAESWLPSEAVAAARQLQQSLPDGQDLLVEVEVDTLEQFRDVISARPDIVLLDNMTPDLLRQAVEIRDAAAPEISLEASGGVRLETVRAIAETGVDRISVGALTHSAVALDVGLDWG